MPTGTRWEGTIASASFNFKLLAPKYPRINSMLTDVLGYTSFTMAKLWSTHCTIDGHGGGREVGRMGGTSCTPLKDFKKLGNKNAINMQKLETLPPSLFSQPNVTSQKNLKITVQLCIDITLLELRLD
jgi:hypothetical protein